jgi:hypothetical protein
LLAVASPNTLARVSGEGVIDVWMMIRQIDLIARDGFGTGIDWVNTLIPRNFKGYK